MSDNQKSSKLSEQVSEHAADYQTENSMTYEEYLKLPEEPGICFEVLDGFLVKDPSPIISHQRISTRLQYILSDYFRRIDPEGEVLSAPLDVVLSDKTVVQPDLLYIPGSDQAAFQETHVFIVPKLVVEILSPSTKRKDRLTKMELYRKAGVEHYWIVDPETRIIEAYLLAEQSYLRVATDSDTTFYHPEFPKLEIEYEQIFID